MENRIEILSLLSEKKALEQQLESLVWGAIEVRQKDDRKYIYVHFRENGIALTRYAGEFSEDLYNLILKNSVRAKAIKKELRRVEKQLKLSGYEKSEIPESVRLNIDFANRHLVDTIYNQAVLEGIATTFADTETILEGGKVNGMAASDVLKVINLKHAWQFVLNENVITTPTNFALLCEINKLVEEGFYYNAGRVRATPVRIGGTDWTPPLPIESVIKEELKSILAQDIDAVDKAIEILLFVMKKQVFLDGNKRTAVIFANHFLISQGKGLIAVPYDKVEEYKALLIAYYEGKSEEIRKFLKERGYYLIPQMRN